MCPRTATAQGSERRPPVESGGAGRGSGVASRLSGFSRQHSTAADGRAFAVDTALGHGAPRSKLHPNYMSDYMAAHHLMA